MNEAAKCGSNLPSHRVQRRAEIIHQNPTLRHTAPSHMIMAGVPLAAVQEIMRHKAIARTLRYAHLSPGTKRSAVDALQIALAGNAEKDAKTA